MENNDVAGTWRGEVISGQATRDEFNSLQLCRIARSYLFIFFPCSFQCLARRFYRSRGLPRSSSSLVNRVDITESRTTRRGVVSPAPRDKRATAFSLLPENCTICREERGATGEIVPRGANLIALGHTSAHVFLLPR